METSNRLLGLFLLYIKVAVELSANETLSCGETYLKAGDDFKFLLSPGYPANSVNNHSECTWTIESVGTSRHIYVEVINSSLGYRSLMGLCTTDRVIAKDGPSIASDTLWTWCGEATPVVRSIGSHLTLLFMMYSGSVNTGFTLKYRAACGSYHTAHQLKQYVISPGFPVRYENNLDCIWVIKSLDFNKIKVIVSDADIDTEVSGCKSDAVIVYDGSSVLSPQLGKFCGTSRPAYISSESSVTVRFHTDGQRVSGGFRLSYESGSFESSCEHTALFASLSRQEITSPSYPFGYPNDADCTWGIITTDSDLIIVMEITYLDIEHHPNCSADYLQAFDNVFGYGEPLGTWCGTEIPPITQSTGQFVYIKFHSNAAITKSGFKLQYWSKLKPEVAANHGAITGGVAAFAVLILVLGCYISYRRRTRPRRVVRMPAIRSVSPRHRSRQSVYTIGNHRTPNMAAESSAPPSYDEVLAGDWDYQNDAPPPTYDSLGSLIDIRYHNSAGVRKNDVVSGGVTTGGPIIAPRNSRRK